MASTAPAIRRFRRGRRPAPCVRRRGRHRRCRRRLPHRCWRRAVRCTPATRRSSPPPALAPGSARPNRAPATATSRSDRWLVSSSCGTAPACRHRAGAARSPRDAGSLRRVVPCLSCPSARPCRLPPRSPLCEQRARWMASRPLVCHTCRSMPSVAPRGVPLPDPRRARSRTSETRMLTPISREIPMGFASRPAVSPAASHGSTKPTNRSPDASTSSRSCGPTTTVVVCSSTNSGPSSRWPGRRSAPRYTGVGAKPSGSPRGPNA